MVTLTGEQAAREDAAQVANSYDDAFLRHPLPVIQFLGQTLELSADFKRQYDVWKTLRDCFSGELTVKRAGQRYLRRPRNVKSADYDTYKNRASFYNATRRTHTGLLGAILRKPSEYRLPRNLRVNMRSVTIDGRSMQEFERELLSEQILVSRFGILADIPEQVPAGVRPDPYLVGYRAEDILVVREVLHRGRKVVDRVILSELETEITEYGHKSRPILRILRLDPDPDSPGNLVYRQEIVRLRAEGQAEERRVFTVTTQGRTLDYIPFVVVNPTKLGPAIEDPILFDLAMLNLAHYEATALLQHGRFYAGMPTYYITGSQRDALAELADGLGTSEPLSVGPSNLWELGENEKPGLLEFTGHGLTFLENAVDSFQLQMQSLGGKLIPTQRKAAALSSEAYGLMESGDEVTLLDVVVQCERALTIALGYMNDLQNNAPDPEALVELNKEFIRSELTAREVRAIQTLYERRLIPLDVLYYTLRQVGVVPQEYSLEEFKQLLGQPGQQYRDPSTQPIPGGPITDPNSVPSPAPVGATE